MFLTRQQTQEFQEYETRLAKGAQNAVNKGLQEGKAIKDIKLTEDQKLALIRAMAIEKSRATRSTNDANFKNNNTEIASNRIRESLNYNTPTSDVQEVGPMEVMGQNVAATGIMDEGLIRTRLKKVMIVNAIYSNDDPGENKENMGKLLEGYIPNSFIARLKDTQDDSEFTREPLKTALTNGLALSIQWLTLLGSTQAIDTARLFNILIKPLITAKCDTPQECENYALAVALYLLGDRRLFKEYAKYHEEHNSKFVLNKSKYTGRPWEFAYITTERLFKNHDFIYLHHGTSKKTPNKPTTGQGSTFIKGVPAPSKTKIKPTVVQTQVPVYGGGIQPTTTTVPRTPTEPVQVPVKQTVSAPEVKGFTFGSDISVSSPPSSTPTPFNFSFTGDSDAFSPPPSKPLRELIITPSPFVPIRAVVSPQSPMDTSDVRTSAAGYSPEIISELSPTPVTKPTARVEPQTIPESGVTIEDIWRTQTTSDVPPSEVAPVPISTSVIITPFVKAAWLANHENGDINEANPKELKRYAEAEPKIIEAEGLTSYMNPDRKIDLMLKVLEGNPSYGHSATSIKPKLRTDDLSVPTIGLYQEPERYDGKITPFMKKLFAYYNTNKKQTVDKLKPEQIRFLARQEAAVRKQFKKQLTKSPFDEDDKAELMYQIWRGEDDAIKYDRRINKNPPDSYFGIEPSSTGPKTDTKKVTVPSSTEIPDSKTVLRGEPFESLSDDEEFSETGTPYVEDEEVTGDGSADESPPSSPRSTSEDPTGEDLIGSGGVDAQPESLGSAPETFTGEDSTDPELTSTKKDSQPETEEDFSKIFGEPGDFYTD